MNAPHAFPGQTGPYSYNDGMLLRDWFAGWALHGILANYTTERFGFSEQTIAQHAYKMADALLAERNREGTK